jgi:transcription initiation factor TFIIB
MCDTIHLPRNVAETAKQIFRQVTSDRVLRGRKATAFVAATIYCACKSNKVPRTFREVCQLTNVSPALIGDCLKEIKLAYRHTFHRKNGEVCESRGATSASMMSPINAVELIARFCNHLGLDASTTRCAEDVGTVVRDQGILDGKNPITNILCLSIISIL